MTNIATIADIASVKEDSILAASGNVLANDSGADLTVANAGMMFGAFGRIQLFYDGHYQYTLSNDSADVQSLQQGEVMEEVYPYVATDGINSMVGWLTVQIAGSDEAPVTADDVASVSEDEIVAASGNVLANDTGLELTVANPGMMFGAFGRIELFQDGHYQYTLNNDSAEVQSLQQGEVVEEVYPYVATDGVASTMGSLTVRITGSNDAPVTGADVADVREDEIVAASGNVLLNDSDADHDTLLSVANPGMMFGAFGRIELFQDGHYQYTLNNDSAEVQSLQQGEVVEEVYPYVATDGVASTMGSLTVRITGSNDAPVTGADVADVREDEIVAASGNVLLNDSDADHDTLLSVANPGMMFGAFGRIELFQDGHYQYTLNNDSAEVQSLQQGEVVEEVYPYVATDGVASTMGSLTVRITGSNDAPVTGADVADVREDEIVAASGNVLLNDSDADHDTLLSVANPGMMFGAFGRIELFQDGHYQYTLNNDSAEVQSLQQGEVVEEVYPYLATDGIDSTFGSLTVQIAGSNDAPVTVDDAASVHEDVSLDVSGNVLANDADADSETVLSVARPGIYAGAYGTLELAVDGSYTYTLANGSLGVQSLAEGTSMSDVFAYAATDGIASTESRLTIGIAGTNDAPVAVADTAAVQANASLPASGNVLDNDSDIDTGTVLRVAAPGTYSGAYGTLVLAQDGAYTYTLDPTLPALQALAAGQRLNDAFDYAASDGITATASTLSVIIAGANDAPVTVNDHAALQEDVTLTSSGSVLANDSDPDAGTVLLVANAGNFVGTYGSLALNADGNYSYTLANAMPAVQSLRAEQTVSDTFTYLASDGIASTPGTLNVSVLGTNDVPVLAHPLSDQSAQVGAAFTLTAPANTFTDIDQGDTLSYSARKADGSALPSWLAFDPASRTFSGTPGAADAGTLQLRLTATDLAGAAADDVFAIGITGGSADRTFNFQVDGVWPSCQDDRTNVGSPGHNGTHQDVSIAGKNRTDAMYVGGVGSDTLNGTSGADALLLDDSTSPRPAGTTGPRIVSIETINMGDGNDVVDLTSTRYTYGNVTVNGGAGKDVLWTSAGNDVLDGGAGDDALAGGAGNDAYVHGVGGGDDVITETGGHDTVLFGAGIAANSVSVRRHEYDLVLSAGANGSVTVKNWFGSESRRVETVQFADGTAWNEAQLSMRASCGYAGWDGHLSGQVAGADGSRANPWGHHDAPRSQGEHGVTHAADVIAALLNKKPHYDFGALAAYMAGQYGDSRGRPLSAAEIGLKWRSLQRFAQGLAQVDAYAKEAAQGRGYAEDLLQVAAAAMGWGYDGSTGRARAAGGMSSLQGLSEGFTRL